MARVCFDEAEVDRVGEDAAAQALDVLDGAVTELALEAGEEHCRDRCDTPATSSHRNEASDVAAKLVVAVDGGRLAFLLHERKIRCFPKSNHGEV